MTKKRKPLAGRSGGSANLSSRDRRDAQAAAEGQTLVFPLKTDNGGNMTLVRHSKGALGVDPSQGMYVIVHAPLALMAGSPFGIAIQLEAESMAVVDDKLASRPDGDSVRIGNITLSLTLSRLQANKENKIDKGVANGYASLDSGGLVPTAQLPATMPPSAHAIDHQDGGSDEVASFTNTGASEIPKALGGGELDPSWFPFGTHAGEVCQGNDSRLSDARAPTGAAGGDLAGTYPNPTFNSTVVTAAAKTVLDDASVSAMRTTLGLGTLATQSGTFSGTSSGTNTGDQTITLTGNVTGSGTGSFATTIAASAVTLAMQANMATASLVYRKTAGSGAPEVNTLATLKTDLGLTGTNSGDQVEADSYASFAKVGVTNFEAWYWANCATGVTATTRAVSANTAYAIPFVAPRRTGCTIDRVAVNATTPAGNVRLAIYDELNGIPNTLKTDFGVVAASGVSSITISRSLNPGQRYFLCAVFDNTPTIRALSTNAAFVSLGTDNTLGTSGNTFLTSTMTYGAWAATFPTTGMAASTGNIPGIAVRYSA